MSAILNGGAIPEVFDYRVRLEPEGTFIGTLNEDFAIESLPGDIFQLGNTSWRILQIGNGVVRVADAQGQPPSMPFWLGEAPSRSDEMSAAVSRLRAAADPKLPRPDQPRKPDELDAAVEWLERDYALSRSAAEQIAAYLTEGKRALGVVPTAGTLVLERFFDEAGGMQLVLHAPLGSRINKAWGLALRKKFCQSFNFELQAAASEEALVLSLGPMHSFALDEVFRYLNPKTVRETLVQAVLDSPIFETRWRWTTTLALAVPRNRSGAKLPAQIQRMIADELLAANFPDAAACLDNIQGARELPKHPLVDQAIRDCLEQAMDLPQLERTLQRVFAGEIRCVAKDTPERLRKSWTREDASRELIRGRTEVLGPVTARSLAGSLGLPETALIDGALLALESEGKLLRGRFTSGAAELEWCDRRLLARIHRYTLNRLRAEIEPVSAADFMRFLL